MVSRSGNVQGEDAGAVSVRGFEPFGEARVVDEAGELEDVGAGDGKAGEVHRGHGALLSSQVVTGSAAESDETTPRATRRNRLPTLNRSECPGSERAPLGAGPWGLTSGGEGARSTSPPAAPIRGRWTGSSSALPLPPVVIVSHSAGEGAP